MCVLCFFSCENKRGKKNNIYFPVPFIFLHDQLQLKYWHDFSNTSLHSNIGELHQNTLKAGLTNVGCNQTVMIPMLCSLKLSSKYSLRHLQIKIGLLFPAIMKFILTSDSKPTYSINGLCDFTYTHSLQLTE